ncbi:hypothetical protein D3105_22520 [Streptomyces globisporus]|uniref:Uncharacterized protein n=1 Tax=Streptomyces globisporus TaxID=1908 RepID=A0A423UVJ0_STRGL|nr:hypothetical protein D3105_22520 [Streptomyces globisporus]
MRVPGTVFAVLLAAVVAGFLAGAAFGAESVDAPRGLFVAGSAALLAAGAAGGAWQWNRRRAARFGISASRCLRVGRGLQRGEVPSDPAERVAAVDMVKRMRRGPASPSHRGAPWLLGGGALLWGAAGVIFVVDGAYGWALCDFAMMGLLLFHLASLRRRGRRLEAAARALGI